MHLDPFLSSLLLFVVSNERSLCGKTAVVHQTKPSADRGSVSRITTTTTTHETPLVKTSSRPTTNLNPFHASSRRHVLLESSLLLTTLSLLVPWSLASSLAAAGVEEPTTTTTPVDEPNYTCLADLPPIPDDSVRIYLCRHGQTENNRLRLVQGSRMNPPLNTVGVEQARRLGQALAAASVPPTALFHSSLERARQTANVAAAVQGTAATTPTAVLKSVAEIDFGPTADGTKVEQAQKQMVATYAQWAFGNLDVKMASDGESGREVLQRVEQAMNDLLEQASKSPNRCIGVVSHSSFLRTLLATIQNISLTQVRTIAVKNASVSVLDVKRDGSRVSLGPKSRLFGGKLFSRADADFALSYPSSTVLRINETRHLGRLG